MQLICPECLGTLATDDGKTARCGTHGGEFQILFSKWKPAPPAPLPLPSTEGLSMVGIEPERNTHCFQHPDAPATHLCNHCGTHFCETCADGGAHCCQDPDVQKIGTPPPIGMAEPPPVLSTMCANHPQTRALFMCRNCGKMVCAVCAYKDADGSRYCAGCMSRRAPHPYLGTSPAEMPPPATARCVQHPNVKASRQCKLCRAFMCGTCDFALPGGVHICPACAAAPQTNLSRKRKKLLIAAYVIAVWCSIFFAAMKGGFFSQFVHTREDVALLGYFIMGFLLLPSIIGFSLSLSAKDRRLPNPPAVWIAIVWNGMILGGFLILYIIGMTKR